MSEPTVTITQAEYDALNAVAKCWDEHCSAWRNALHKLETYGFGGTAERFESACNAMDDAVAEAVRKEKKA